VKGGSTSMVATVCKELAGAASLGLGGIPPSKLRRGNSLKGRDFEGMDILWNVAGFGSSLVASGSVFKPFSNQFH